MTIPHDFRTKDSVELLSRDNNFYYEEPDYIAMNAGDQLPLVSTIGAGPRGAGVKVQKVQGDAEGVFRLAFIDDSTGEVFEMTPNLDLGYIEVSSSNTDPQEGEIVTMFVRHVRGNQVTESEIALPAGAHGSRMYLSDQTFDDRTDKTFVTSVSDLIHYGLKQYTSKPVPRPGDIVAFNLRSGTNKLLAFGTIEAVEKDAVTFTSRTSIGLPMPTLGENGHWYVDGIDTGISAIGPVGPRGPEGPQGIQGQQGKKGETGAKGEKGENGKDGMKATVKAGTTTLLPAGSKASVSFTTDETDNSTTINFGIPEGTPGDAINIQGGIWTTDTLPSYDDTPINTAFVVHDDDLQFDLYIRGKEPVTASDGGPWTVVENWQGRPGTGIHFVTKELPPIGETLQVAAADKDTAFVPSEYIDDNDVCIDEHGTIGIIQSSTDDSGYYEVEVVGATSSNILDGQITEAKLDADLKAKIAEPPRVGEAFIDALFAEETEEVQ